MNRLRKFAASIGVTLVALGPLLIASPAHAQTLSEAQAALATGKQEVIDATLNKSLADQAVAVALANLQAATANTAAAQSDYDTNLISDPTWVAPTQQVEHTRQVETVETVRHVTQVPHTTTVEHVTRVPHTETITHVNQVCHIESVGTTTSVPTTVSVPHTELVSTTTHVPTTTTIEHTTTTVVPGGLTAKSYNRIGYNNAPPLPTANETPVSTENVPNIDYQWGGGEILNSGLYEDVLVAFEGNIMVPTDGWYTFYAPGDDGVKLTIAGMDLIDDWYDKGGGGSLSEPMWIRAGILYPTTLYYYENGGGANVWLYYSTADTELAIVPPSWFGETTVTETTYEEITTWDTVVSWEEVTTYEDVIIWEDVTTYEDVQFCEDVTTYEEVTTWEEIVTYEDVVTWEEVVTFEDVITVTTETFFTTELVPNVFAPLVHDPVLEAVLNDKVAVQNIAESEHSQAIAAQAAAVTRLNSANDAIAPLEQAVIDLTPVDPPVVDPGQGSVEEPTPPEDKPVVPPVVEEPVAKPLPEPPVVTPEPPIATVDPSTIDPTTLTPEDVTVLQEAAYETLAVAEQGSPEYEQALEQLWVAAEADDIEVDPALAAIPLLGNAAVALADAVNFVGNVGADMSPKVREESKKIVVSAVVAVGAAVSAATNAATGAASAAASASASTGSRRVGK